MPSMSALDRILELLERFQPQKITRIANTRRETMYEWHGKSGQKYRAWCHNDPSTSEPNKHYVGVAFGTVHTDEHGNEVERVDSHDLPDDATDTLATVHRIVDHYIQKKVATRNPNITHLVISNDPVKSAKDAARGAKSPKETQRGRVYMGLMHRALTTDPKNAGITAHVTDDIHGMHMHLAVPGGLKAHYDTNGESSKTGIPRVPPSMAAIMSRDKAPATMTRKGVASSDLNSAAQRIADLLERSDDPLDHLIAGYTGGRIKGGKGDHKDIASFPRQTIKAGLKVEMEHTADPKKALEIVIDHLSERPDYYKKLAKAGLVDEALLLEFPHTDLPFGGTYDAELEKYQHVGGWGGAVQHLKSIFDGEPKEDKYGGKIHLKTDHEKKTWMGELHSHLYMQSFLKKHGKTWADLHAAVGMPPMAISHRG